jgi:hypothetical protein
MLGISAVVMTHHLTSYFLVLLLMAWVLFDRIHADALLGRVVNAALNTCSRIPIVSRIIRGNRLREAKLVPDGTTRKHNSPTDLAAYALLFTLAWLFTVANVTVNYLQPVISRALLSIVRLALHQGTSRQLFVSNAGTVAPLFDRLIGTGSVVLALLVLPFGLYVVYRRRADHPLILLLGMAAVGYFVMQGFRFTPDGWETANRASEYLYIGLSFVLALGFVEVILPRIPTALGGMLFTCYVAIILTGGIISGWVPQLRLPQPYLVTVGDQTIPSQEVAVALWTNNILGPDHVFSSDASNVNTLIVYGDQYTISGRTYDANALIYQPVFSTSQAQSIEEGQIQYILVDRRQISGNNMLGIYFDRANLDPSAEWLDPNLYQKYDKLPRVDRILDSGAIVIYDIGALTNGSTTP